jgi:hypothetical protein
MKAPWAWLGHKAEWAGYLTRLARLGEKAEMGGLHSRTGPKVEKE